MNPALGMQFHRIQIHFEHAFTKQTKLQSNTLFAFSRTDARFDTAGNEPFRILTDAYVVGQRLKVTHEFSDALSFRSGLDLNAFYIDARVSVPTRATIGDVPAPDWDPLFFKGSIDETEVDLAGFMSIDWELIDGLRIIPGLRIDWFHYNGANHVTADPRLTVRWDVVDNLTIKGGTGVFHQAPALQEIDEQYGNPEVQPERSIQSSLGFELRLPGDWEIDITGFYNHLSNIPYFTSDVQQTEDDGLDRVTFDNRGEGRAYGVELIARKKIGDWIYGWLTYTLSRSERLVDAGHWEEFDFSQTHILNLAWTVLLPYEISIGARFRLTSGNITTRIVGSVYDADADAYDPVIQGKDRLPFFHQLDVRIDKTWTFEDWIFVAYLDVQNVYYAENAEFYRYKYDYSVRVPINGVPILPTLGVRAVF